MNALRHDIMGFDDSVEGERLRRHMNASERAMHRALAAIIKMRKDLEFHEFDAADGTEALDAPVGNHEPNIPNLPTDIESDPVPTDTVDEDDGELQSKATVIRNEPENPRCG